MTFNDDDLKRLKDNLGWDQDWVLKKLPDLLARLEAAENLIFEYRNTHIPLATTPRKTETALFAWRKAAGK